MLKKIIILFLSANLYAADQKLQSEGWSKKQIAAYCAVGVGGTATAVLLAPYVLPAGTIVAIKTALAAGAAKVAAAGPVAAQISGGLKGVRCGCELIKPYIPGPEDKLKKLLEDEMQEFKNAQLEFEGCLLRNQANNDNNKYGVPKSCEYAAMKFALYKR
jgi:hypothetical protein